MGSDLVGTQEIEPLSHDEKTTPSEDESSHHVEKIASSDANLVYDHNEEEPELHARTYIAVLAMFLMNFAQLFGLQGPPVVLTWIGESFHDTDNARIWVSNAFVLSSAVLGPVLSSVSDVFQARKFIFLGACLLAIIGSAVAPKSRSIYELIAAQTLIGFGFAVVPLTFTVPSEILPRKWRPMVQGYINIGAAFAAVVAPLAIGILTKHDLRNGWRHFYWIQLALWVATGVCILIGYRPPKRHTRLDHLSWRQKLKCLDLFGSGLITAGLTLFLVGLNLGSPGHWADARVLGTLITGIVVLCFFAVFEWKGTKDGLLNHDLFRGGKAAGRTFAICVWLNFLEGTLTFAYIVYYPIMTSSLFETDPYLLAARCVPFYIAAAIAAPLFGYASTKLRRVREFLFVGFVIFTGAYIGFTTIQPDDNLKAIVFAALSGLGFGGPIVLIIATVQLSTPHRLMTTATAVVVSARVVAGTIFTAIYSAALNARLTALPENVSRAAAQAGLPARSVPLFTQALLASNTTALSEVPGVTPTVIGLGIAALRQTFADALRVVFIIAAPFGVVACISCLFIGDMRSTMNYHVDAPVEHLHAKANHSKTETRV